LRVVPQSGKSGKVTVYFTVPNPNKYSLELFRAGETESQIISLKNPGSRIFETTLVEERVELELELDHKDLGFAIEGLIHVVS
jgi:hypothetical protein